MANEEINLYQLAVLNPRSRDVRRQLVFAPTRGVAELMALHDPEEVVTAERATGWQETLRRAFFRKRASVSEMRRFYDSMASSLQMDGSMSRALELAVPDLDSPTLQYACGVVMEQIADGQDMGESLDRFDGVLPEEHIAMLKAGVESGKTLKVFQQLAENLDRLDSSITKIKRALIYPSIVFVIGFGAFISATLFLVPKLEEMFRSFKAKLPLITRAMLELSDLLRSNPIIIVGLFASIVLVVKSRRTLWQSKWAQEIVDAMPPVRKIIFKANMGQALSTMSLLLSAGISTEKALEMASKAASHARISEFFLAWRRALQGGASVFEGANLNRHLLGTDGIQLMVMIYQAEKNADLERVLARVARAYHDDVDGKIKGISVLIEPLTIVCVGLLIGLIALAVMLPLAQLNNLILPSR